MGGCLGTHRDSGNGESSDLDAGWLQHGKY